MRLIDLIQPKDLQPPAVISIDQVMARANEMDRIYGERIREIADAMVVGSDIRPSTAFGIMMTLIDSIDAAIERQALGAKHD